MKRRVVVTGIGTINSIGKNADETWNGLINGVCGIDYITHFDTEDYNVKFAAEIKGYDSKDYFDKKEAKKIDNFTQYAIIAADEAVKDSGITEADNFEPERTGCIFGAGIGGQLTFEEEAIKMHTKGARRVSPFFIPKMISNIAPAHIAIKHNLKAINFNVVSACTSANHAIGTAFRAIQYGEADAVVTGGAEAAITPLAVAGFSNMKALSTRNDDPKGSSRPFDKDRDGFVMGEGAGVIVIEELEHALKRGAKIYAEIKGYMATCDAFHITAPVDNGEGGARAMAGALKDAGMNPEEIDYVNAHGTSTPLNDKTESLAIRTVFGDHADNLKISSTKSMVGHSLGAAAAIEAMVCCKTITEGIIHPTINYTTPDPDCDLYYTPNKAIKQEVKAAISNSLGFGGHNSTIVFKKFEN